MGMCGSTPSRLVSESYDEEKRGGKGKGETGVNDVSVSSVKTQNGSVSGRNHPLGLPHGHEITKNSPLSAMEIKARILSGTESVNVPGNDGTDFTMRYAFLSQRGYYPEDLTKPNQDSFTIIENFCNNEKKIFFGVFDGHGKDGDLASYFAKEKIPNMIAKQLAKYKTQSLSDDKKIATKIEESSHTNAFIMTNDEVCHQPIFDTAMSGTTAVTATITARDVFICNCGDSRALVAVKQSDGSLKAKPLTFDQTPHRRDELERCKRAGAMVCNMSQLEGEEPLHENWAMNLGEQIDDGGDPPRLFLPNEMYPGVAFTRSIGDYVAQSVGCIADPETAKLQLKAEHKFMVIASDGVWEFLTNQQVVDIMDECSNPLEACRVIVNESYNQWLHWETRTDDITVIAIWFDGLSNKTPSLQVETSVYVFQHFFLHFFHTKFCT